MMMLLLSRECFGQLPPAAAPARGAMMMLLLSREGFGQLLPRLRQLEAPEVTP